MIRSGPTPDPSFVVCVRMRTSFTLAVVPLATALSLGGPVRGPVRVWDGVFAAPTLDHLKTSGNDRGHSFTSIFDRGEGIDQPGRTVIESALCTVLQEVGDESRYIEYWWRGESKGMEVHRDVDEALCRSHKVGGVGVQICPTNGHVLYLDVAPGVRGPTCVWEEEPDVSGAAELKAKASGGDPRAGAPRDLHQLHVVPAVAGRLLRFDGASLHSVLGPNCDLLEGPAGQGSGSVRRAVILFNTWRTDPPGLPSPKDPAAPKAVEALAALAERPACEPASTWRCATPTAPLEAEEDMSLIDAPLLGDVTRRGCEVAALNARVASAALRKALESDAEVHSLRLFPCEGPAAAEVAPAAAAAAEAAAAVQVDEDEELAMRLGHAAHLESEFWGVEDAEDEDDEYFDDDDDDEPSDFMAKVAALQALELEQRGGADAE